MAYKVPSFSTPKGQEIKYWPSSAIHLNGGLNLVDKEWKIANNETSKVLNMWWYDGELSKRWGQEYINEKLADPIISAYSQLYSDHIIFHSGTKLYKLGETLAEIYSEVTATKGTFFKFNGKLYYLQPGKYLEIDSDLTVTAVDPYIPVVIFNREPVGGGEVYEDYNRIGKGFTNHFNGNGTAVNYTLTDGDLDATAVTCTVDGTVKTEGTDFTVNRTTGVVTFNQAPASGTNNVHITAYKTVQDDIDTILNCKYAIPFGGQNDNRLFVGGNGTGNFYWTGISASGIDASYFAYNNYNVIGNPDEDITGFAKHHEVLTIHKESGEIYGETYVFDGAKGIFSTYSIATKNGCDCPDTIQNIMNSVVWLNSKTGPQILLSTDRTNQRNVMPLGRNINPRLLEEENLTSATSIDFNGHYWLCVNDKAYLWNYYISPYYDTGNPEENAHRLSWWYFDSINASQFITDGAELYYSDRTDGLFVKFHREYDNQQFYDFGKAIKSIYRIPLRDLGGGVHEFDVLKAWIDCRGDTRTAITVTYITSDDLYGDPVTDEITVGSFSYDNFSYDTFTYQVMGFKETFPLDPMEKKIDLFGIEFTNEEGGRDMNIGNVVYSYRLGKRK